MTRRREPDEQWPRMVWLLRSYRGTLAESLVQAQRLFDAAPNLALPPLLAQSVVSLVVHNRSEQLESSGRRWLGHLVFSADTFPRTDTRCAQPVSVIGVHENNLSNVSMVVVRSDDVDADHLIRSWSERALEWGVSPTDPIVYDVMPGFHELGRSESRRVRQGTVRWVVYPGS